MTARGAALLTLGLGIGTAACAPSFQHLLSARRHADAICLANTADEAAAAVTAVERDADPRLNLYPVHEPELAPVLGEEVARRALDEVLLLRARTAHGALSVNLLSVDVTIRDTTRAPQDERSRAVLSVRYPGSEEWLGLMRLTGERPPPASRSSREITEIDQQALGLAIFTLGMSRLFSSKPITRTVKVEASSADWEDTAPVALALARGLSDGGSAAGYVLREEPGHELRAGLILSASDRLNDGGPCELDIHYDLAVPPLRPSAAPALDRMFGTRMRSLRELPVSARWYRLSNPFGSWSSPPPARSGGD